MLLPWLGCWVLHLPFSWPQTLAVPSGGKPAGWECGCTGTGLSPVQKVMDRNAVKLLEQANDISQNVITYKYSLFVILPWQTIIPSREYPCLVPYAVWDRLALPPKIQHFLLDKKYGWMEGWMHASTIFIIPFFPPLCIVICFLKINKACVKLEGTTVIHCDWSNIWRTYPFPFGVVARTHKPPETLDVATSNHNEEREAIKEPCEYTHFSLTPPALRFESQPLIWIYGVCIFSVHI